MQLKDLKGKHILTGVEFGTRVTKDWADRDEDCQTMSFCLDGKTYTVIEDPGDGYRSSMKEIIESDIKLITTLPSIEVEVKYLESEVNYGGLSECDLIQLIDTENDQVILEAGTRNTDDYYPFFVTNWTPENLSINEPWLADFKKWAKEEVADYDNENECNIKFADLEEYEALENKVKEIVKKIREEQNDE